MDEQAGSNLFQYVYNSPVDFADPLGLKGWITIYSRTGGNTGHSWITYKPDCCPEVTYETWRGSPLLEGAKIDRGEPEAVRSVYIDDDGEAEFWTVIKKYRALGDKAWKLSSPCSSFAAETFNAATHEGLSAGFPSTPFFLKNSINRLNTRSAVGDYLSLPAAGALP